MFRHAENEFRDGERSNFKYFNYAVINCNNKEKKMKAHTQNREEEEEKEREEEGKKEE